MPFKDFLYYFTEEDGRSLYVENGIVRSGGQHRPLPGGYDGWAEISIAWERNMSKYYGLNRNFSLPLGFYFDAAYILRHAFYTANIERKIYLLIQQLELVYGPSNYKYLYKYLYKGELDFSTFKSDSDRVTISIMEGGLSKQFKANENTTYTIPFDDAKELYMDGVQLEVNAKYFINNGGTTGGVNFAFRNHFVGLLDITSDNSLKLSTKGVEREQFYNTDNDLGGNLNWFFAASVDCILSLTWDFKVGAIITTGGVLDPGGRTSIMFQVVADGQVDVGRSVQVFSGLLSATGDTFTGSVDIPIKKGDFVYFRTFFTVIGATGDEIIQYTYFDADIDHSFLELSAFYKSEPSLIKIKLPFDAYKDLVEKITGSPDNAESALLSTTYKDYALTCGDAIRGIAGASIKTSLSDFFEDYNVTCFGGLSIDNGKIKIESRASFFDTSNPIDLGIVKNHEQSYAVDLSGNVVKAGHTKPDIEDVNGKFDPNGSSVYTLPITRVAKEINLVGPYKKGPYEIEITRINLNGKTTTDNNNDNDCFVLHVKENPETFTGVSGTTDGANLITLTGLASSIAIFQSVMALFISGLGNTVFHRIESVTVNGADLDIVTKDDVAGSGAFSGYVITFPYTLNRDAVVDTDPEVCPSPATIFNVVFTPKNILKLHGRWLRSILLGFDTEKIKHQSGDKNTKFKAVVNGITIDEDTDEDISLLGERLFYPVYHDFETLVPINLVELMEENPNRCFRFTDADTDEVFTGFNIKSGLAPNTLQPQQFKLLSTPLNDLTQLIY